MALTLGKSMKPQKLTKKNIPVKRFINLAAAGEKKTDYRLFALSLVLILLALGLFGKFAVYDRLVAVDRARAAVDGVRYQIDRGNAEIKAYGELATKYAHYTYSGLTEQELQRADRVAIINMMTNRIIPTNYVESWTLKENMLTLYISGKTLQELNLVTQYLEQDELVDYCTVQTASTNDLDDYYDDAFAEVTAQLVIHLKRSEEVRW